MKVSCIKCRGSKKLLKLGGIIGDCSVCNGTGFIDNSGDITSAKNAIENDYSAPKGLPVTPGTRHNKGKFKNLE